MNYEVKKTKGEVTIDFTIPADEWSAEMEAAYNRTKFKYNIHGFRKGKVPRKIIENMYGKGVFFDDAFEHAAAKAYSTALQAEEISPVDDPKISLGEGALDGNDFHFTAVVTITPEVELGEYKNLTIPKSEYPVSADDINKEIETARERAARTVKVEDRAVQDGDTANINYSGSVDGIKFDGGTAEKFDLVIGSNSFIPGFEPQIIGMKIGESKDITVKFPDEYHAENLKGKDAVFAVTVNEISVKELPELNDEFARDRSKFETFADYKADVEKRLGEQATQKADTENKNKLIEKITENANADIPECMIKEETEYMLKDMEYRLQYMYGGMKLDDYFKHTGSSREEFAKQSHGDAQRAVKTRLVLREIIKTEKIEVTDADFDAHVEKIAANSGKNTEEYKNSLNDRQAERIKNDLLVNKTLDTLVSLNKFEVSAVEKEKPAKKSAPKAQAKTEENSVESENAAPEAKTTKTASNAKAKE